MKHLPIFFLTFILLSCTFFSCIPSQPTPHPTPEKAEPATSPVPNLSPQNLPEKPTISTTENKPAETTSSQVAQIPKDKRAKTTLRFGTAESGFPFSIQQTPLENQEGFSIKGSFGLSGTITRPDKTKDLWVFAGQFELPSEDYQIGEVTYDILNAPIEYYTQKQPLPPNFVPQVMITIPVKLPPHAKDEKGEIKVPFRLEIPVSEKANFIITLIDKH